MPPIELTPVSGRYLSFTEREDIALLRAKGMSMRDIADRIGRSPSTISRELRRNAATRNGKLEYRASTAQWKADLAARRPKPAKLAEHDRLREYVQDKLSGVIRADDGTVVAGPDAAWIGRNKPRRGDRRWATAWSPEQISNRLPIDYPDDPTMRISPEAIYQSLYIEGSRRLGAGARRLLAHRPGATKASCASAQTAHRIHHRGGDHQRPSGRGREPEDAGALGGQPRAPRGAV